MGATVSAGPSASAGAPTDLARRAAHTMTALPGGGLLVAGGCVVDGCGTATTSAYVLDGVRAEPTGPLGQPRDAHTATALPDGRVLVTGGFTAEGRAPLSSAEVYDPQTRRWTTSGSLRTARGGHAAGLLGDGRVLVAGGWVGYHTFTESTEIFEPATGRFAPGPSLPAAVLGLAATSLADGSVLLTGGESRPGQATRLAVRVLPDGTLRRVGPLITGRFKHTMVTLPSGQALVIGGTTDDQDLLADTEIFDPATDEFRAGPAAAERPVQDLRRSGPPGWSGRGGRGRVRSRGHRPEHRDQPARARGRPGPGVVLDGGAQPRHAARDRRVRRGDPAHRHRPRDPTGSPVIQRRGQW